MVECCSNDTSIHQFRCPEDYIRAPGVLPSLMFHSVRTHITEICLQLIDSTFVVCIQCNLWCLSGKLIRFMNAFRADKHLHFDIVGNAALLLLLLKPMVGSGGGDGWN